MYLCITPRWKIFITQIYFSTQKSTILLLFSFFQAASNAPVIFHFIPTTPYSVPLILSLISIHPFKSLIQVTHNHHTIPIPIYINHLSKLISGYIFYTPIIAMTVHNYHTRVFLANHFLVPLFTNSRATSSFSRQPPFIPDHVKYINFSYNSNFLLKR